MAELRNEAARRNEITVDLILRELEEARVGALVQKQFGAAVQASMGRAKVAGLIVDRSEVESNLRSQCASPSASPS